jgi:signal transduction histidine kinase
VRIRGDRWLLAGLAFVVLAILPGFAASAPQPDAPAWRVVLMRGWDSSYPANLVREKALREALTAGSPRPVEFYPEEIDPLRFPGAADSDFMRLLSSKYADLPMDLVVASGLDSLEFVAAHRDAIWPGAAVVFNGVFEGSSWRREPRITGITLPLDVHGTLALGRALVPAMRRLYVVAGSAAFDQQMLSLVRAQLAGEDASIEVSYLTGLTRGQASARLAAIEPDSAVLYLTMLRDADGVLSGPTTPTMVHVIASSNAPVLSLVDTQFGRGPLGGSAAAIEAHGRAAGELARRVLEGADPDAIAVQALPAPACEVDWNALARWKLAERNIPGACSVRNRPTDPLRSYAWMIAATAAIILLQAALLSALLVQSRRRRAAEEKLRARTAQMAEESRLAIMGALTANLAHEINQPMGAILSNTEAAQLMLEQGTLTPDKLREILADIRSDDIRASEVIKELRALFGRGDWRPVPLEVNAEVAEALRHMSFEASRHEVTLSPAYGVEMPAVMGDPVQLQQVVVNLVANAIDAVASLASFRRVVRVLTSVRRDGVEISVSDEGPGLSAQDAERLFESTFTTKKRTGMGFGLSIVRSIVEMHNGKVWFEPNVPRGAVFRVWLPAIGA